jgi:twitching motility protein PilT
MAEGVDKILSMLLDEDVSDIHFKVNHPPIIRTSGRIVHSESFNALGLEHVDRIARDLMTEKQVDAYERGEEVDLAHSVPGKARFRVNIFHQRGSPAIVMRKIPFEIPEIEDLGLPMVVKDIALEQRGLVLVTGATGSGKSTTLASMIEHINRNRETHIVTIEDPIEFLHSDELASICQREVGLDTPNWHSALRSVFRQDPDVILIGEMRDRETASVALTGAETGHLVMSTLHTLDAQETVNRIIDMFSAQQQTQVRVQLGGLLKAVISQRLLPSPDGESRVLAAEVMMHTALMQECISNPEKTASIRDVMDESGAKYGMQTFDMALIKLLSEGKIDTETALAAATNPTTLQLKLDGVQKISEWEQRGP